MQTVANDEAIPNSTRQMSDRRPERTLIDYFGLMLRGFAMGCSDVVPGVSGGTMAFILGIYEELIDSIRVVGQPHFLQAVFRFRIKEVFQILNWKFLVSVFLGIALAILTLAQGLEWLLHNEPVFLWSFFFGLVLASVVAVSKRIKQWSAPLIGMTLLGTLGAFMLVGLVPLETPNAWWFYFLSGALAICAMILPGISGAFILVLLGKYMDILAAVNDRDIVTIAFVGAGAIIGLVSFAQILGWLFKRYHDLTVALLIGLMIGSLRKIWPWKDVVESIERKGEIIPIIEHNILPALNSDLGLAIALGVVGFMLVMGLDRWAGQAEH